MAIYVEENNESQEIEPGYYPQDDGTVNVVMSEPIVFGKGDTANEVWTVKLHRQPSPAEMKKLNVGKLDLLQMYDWAHQAVLPLISEPQITPRIYEQLDGGNQQLLIMGNCHFFAPKQRKGMLKA